MKHRKQPKAPRSLLICCEGRTEQIYFDILLDFFRLPGYVKVEIYGQKGQHFALIDNTVEKRKEIHSETGFSQSEIESWAVCDEDRLPCSFNKLAAYAEERDVNLAFSAPQFEMYLLQHFEQSSSTKQSEVYRRLSFYRNQNGGIGKYDNSTKADLNWMATAIDKKPKIVLTAITNCDLRDREAKRPFFTVQNLSRRILELKI